MTDKGYDRQSLLLKKNHLENRYKVLTKHRQEDEVGQFINSNGIVSPIKLMVILCLIILSISCLQRANNTHWPHVKALTNYFSYYVLQQNDLSIYDRGDNLDQTYIEIIDFSEMQDHLHNLVSLVQNYTECGFTQFNNKKQQRVDMQYYYNNGSLSKKYVSFAEFKQIIQVSDLRELLLGLRVLYFQIQFGDNNVIDDFKLVFDYEIYSFSMLKLDMSTKYKTKAFQGKLREEFVLRNMERLLAAILIIAYSIQARKLFYNDKLNKEFRKNSLYWCFSLILMNSVSILSSTLAPTCAVMQLLPIIQNYDSSNSLTYNFNVNLRYAIPVVFRIILPVYTILTGFILYSMLMYPGQYFDDFVTGFFSYFYNNFQYGIYEIFIQIRSRGNVAYLLYVILYFYMVLVGSNLIPAFFCTLIYQKMAEQELVRYVENRLGLVVCPKCMSQGYQRYNYGLQININSPKSPYLRSGTKLRHMHEKNEKIARMFIEEQDEIRSPLLSPIDTIKSKHKKARDLVAELNLNVDKSIEIATANWIQWRLDKIQQCLQRF